ncbi:MAG: M20 family metallopeptidase [Candidatus Caldarchaeum sp.]
MAEAWVRAFIEDNGSRLVAINTENPPGREREAASFFAEKAAEHGLKSRLVSHGGDRASALVEVEWGEGPTVVFNSHLDTVPAGPVERWPFHPFRTGVKNGYLCGRGSADAKGCLTSMLAAVAMLGKREGLSGRVVLMAVADEEVEGLGSLSLAKELDRMDYVVVGEPTSLKVCVASRGRVEISVEFLGKPAHSSTPKKGVNAVTAAAKAVVKLASLEKGFGRRDAFMGRSSAAVTMLQGGLKSNVIPDRARFTVDYRTVGETPEQALKTISSYVKKAVTSKTPFKATITYAAPSFKTDANSKIVKACRKALWEAGVKPVLTGLKALTDLNRVAKQRPVEGVVLGPGDLSLAHTFSEKVAVSELVKAAEVYRRLAENLLSHPTP